MSENDDLTPGDDWLPDIDPSKVYTKDKGPFKSQSKHQTQKIGKPAPTAMRAPVPPAPSVSKPSSSRGAIVGDLLDHPDHVLEDLPDLTPWQEEVERRVAMDVHSGVLWGPRYIKDRTVGREPNKDTFLQEVRLFAASCFLQHNGRFIDVERPDIELTINEVFRALSQKIFARFPDHAGKGWLPEKAIKEIMEGVVDGLNADPRYAFGLFSGKRYMLPGNPSPRLYRDGYWDINLWKEPKYRQIEPTPAFEGKPLGAFGDVLEFAITDPQDRQVLLDWITWSLNNEAAKPSWAVFLFSEEKGTGKSTILEFVRALFGEENCSAQNGIEGVTGRFPEDILNKKIITLEEVKLTSFSSSGNTLKEYITGISVSVERKNRNERVRLPLRAGFLLTSNHRPSWLEGGERRYYIIDVTHDGCAFGPKQADFVDLVTKFKAQINDPAQLNRLYLELRSRELSSAFNPHVLRQQNQIMRDMTVEDVNETDAVLEDLFDQHGIELIPSSEQYLLVRHLRLKNEQDLQSRLRRLGFSPERRRIDKSQVRVWMKKDALVENGRLYSPTLTAQFEARGELTEATQRGFVWWPLTTLAKHWDRLARTVLGAVDKGGAKAELARWSQNVGSDESEENGKVGPFNSSTSIYAHGGGEGPYHSPFLADGSELVLVDELKDVEF